MDRVVEIARSWVGTRFHHQGRVKGQGVDCIGLIAGVAQELGIEFEDKQNYAREPQNGELQKELEKYLRPCELQNGCVALFKIDKEPQHVGIVGEWRLENGESKYTLIHAYAQARKVVEHGFDELWRKRMVATYQFR